jgi:signal transduction histidine kinase
MTAHVDEWAPAAAIAGAPNVVPFRSAALTTEKAPTPSAAEQKAFDEPLRQASARIGAVEPAARTEQANNAVPAQATDQAKAQPALTGALSHEIRVALNSIVGFSETMLEERFGPIGNERYRGYLADIRSAGQHVAKLLHGLAGVSDITGVTRKADFINLSEIVQGCVAQLQPQASRAHVLIRASLAPASTLHAADANAVRQLVVDLLSNAIRSTGAGSQVIVSTSITPGTDGGAGDVILRVRDTGGGLGARDAGAGLDSSSPGHDAAAVQSPESVLAIARGFAEANGARFAITSGASEGTLVEITFPGAARPPGGTPRSDGGG